MGGSWGRTRDGAGTREGSAAPGLRRARHRGRAGLPAAGVAQESHVNRNEAASSRIANAMRGPRHARSASESVRKRPPRPLSHVARPRGRVEAARTRRRRRRCRLRFAPPAKVLQEPHILKMKNKQKITFYERKNGNRSQNQRIKAIQPASCTCAMVVSRSSVGPSFAAGEVVFERAAQDAVAARRRVVAGEVPVADGGGAAIGRS